MQYCPELRSSNSCFMLSLGTCKCLMEKVTDYKLLCCPKMNCLNVDRKMFGTVHKVNIALCYIWGNENG